MPSSYLCFLNCLHMKADTLEGVQKIEYCWLMRRTGTATWHILNYVRSTLFSSRSAQFLKVFHQRSDLLKLSETGWLRVLHVFGHNVLWLPWKWYQLLHNPKCQFLLFWKELQRNSIRCFKVLQCLFYIAAMHARWIPALTVQNIADISSLCRKLECYACS